MPFRVGWVSTFSEEEIGMLLKAKELLNEIEEVDPNLPKISYEYSKLLISKALSNDTIAEYRKIKELLKTIDQFQLDKEINSQVENHSLLYTYKLLSTNLGHERFLKYALEKANSKRDRVTAYLVQELLLKHSDNNESIYFAIAQSKMVFKDYESAIKDYLLCIEKSSDSRQNSEFFYAGYRQAHFHIAEAFHALDRDATAYEYYIWYVSNYFFSPEQERKNPRIQYTDASYIDALFNIARINVFINKDYEMAVIALDELVYNCTSENLCAYEDLTPFYWLRGIAFENNQRFEEALRDFVRYQSGTTNFKSDPFFFYHTAVCKKGLGNNIGALADINRAILLKPFDRHYLIYRSWIKTDLGDYYGAIKDVEESISITSDRIEDLGYYYNLIAINHSYIGNKDEACKTWSKAGELGYVEAYEHISEYCK